MTSERNHSAGFILQRLIFAYTNYRHLSLFEYLLATKHERALRALLFFELRSISAHIEHGAFDAATTCIFKQWFDTVMQYIDSWVKE